MAKKEEKKNKSTLHAVGRRKTSKCTINIFKGEGENMVNSKKLEEYFNLPEYKSKIFEPFIKTDTLGKYYFNAKVSGGGVAGQADALRLAIARSLSNIDQSLHEKLSSFSLLTRDPRAKERKKVFFVRARKKPQYSKR